MADLMTISGIDAYADFKWGGTTYTNMAIASISMSYPLNNLPTAQLRPAIGQPLLAVLKARSSLQNASTGLETGPIQVYLIVTKKGTSTKYLAFDGWITGMSASQAFSATAASAGLVINCTHKFSQIATLPPVQRVMNPVTCLSNVENYQNGKLYSKVGVPYPSEEEVGKRFKIGKFGTDCMGGLILLFKWFYELENNRVSEGKGGFESGPAQEGVIELLNKVNTTHMELLPTFVKEDQVLHMKILPYMCGQWETNSGWSLLLSYVNQLWGHLLLTADTYKIIPNISGFKATTTTIEQTDVFGVSRNRPIDPVPVVGIALQSAEPNGDDAARASTTQELTGTTFYMYPEKPVEQGMYMYMKPPDWMEMYKKMKDASAPGSAGNVRCNEVPSGNKTYTNKTQDPTGVDKQKEWMTNLAKTMFGEYKWMRDGMALEISMDKFLQLAPGHIVALNLKNPDSATQNNLFTDNYVGQIKSMDMTCFPGEARFNISVGNLRTVAENDTYALTEHPLYSNFKAEDLKGITIFKKV